MRNVFESTITVRTVLLSAFFTLFAIVVQAQVCAVQSLGFPAEQNNLFAQSIMGSVVGQTFEACLSGNVTEVAIKMDDNNTYVGTMNFWIAAEPGDGNTIGGSPYQTFEIVNANLDGVYSITPNPPFYVTNGSVYRVEFSPIDGGTSRIDANASGQAPNINSYPDGTLVAEGDYQDPSAAAGIMFADLNFRVSIEFVEIVPTLSEWGIIILGLCLLIFGVVTFKMRVLRLE